MKLPALLLAAALLASCSPDEPAGGQQAGPAAPTQTSGTRELSQAQQDFLDLDFDGRWGWYRREVREQDDEVRWAEWLHERGEFEFLEWLALCRPERWSVYGGVLVRADDPRWLQLAAWTLDSTVVVDAQSARAALLTRPGLTLDWLEQHHGELSESEALLREELVAQAPEREDATGYSAPLGEGTVYLGLLREARLVREGTATAAPAPEQPSRGDALRSILALRSSKRRSAQLLDALADVARHPDATLAMAVAACALQLEPMEVPTQALLSVMRDDERPMALREAALEAVAHGPRYAAYVEFLKFAFSPRHPLWPAAVRQLGRMGDWLAASYLGELTDAELDETQRPLRDAALASIAARGKLDEQQFLEQLTDYMELLTYADLAGGLIRDKAIRELAGELRERLFNYDLKYKLKEVMVQYQAPERLAIGLDADLWTARLREHCTDAISY
ncbi:MAG: hypothetical protein H6831_16450 [Planctomycetes bacterium]|nr:hypothetical protein [Planctomycetota bacterium]MCB9905992.1 hypothetical protein [Planctomycetota bacterium]